MTAGAVRDDGRSKLRADAQSAMLSALGLLDQLGDEGAAAATLQHAIDRLSYQAGVAALGCVTDPGTSL